MLCYLPLNAGRINSSEKEKFEKEKPKPIRKTLIYPSKIKVIGGEILSEHSEDFFIEENCTLSHESFLELLKFYKEKELPLIIAATLVEKSRFFFFAPEINQWLFQKDSFNRDEERLHPTLEQPILKPIKYFCSDPLKNDDFHYLCDEYDLDSYKSLFNNYALATLKNEKISESLYSLGYFYHDTNQVNLAEYYFNLAVQKYNHLCAKFYLGVMYLNQNEVDLAEEYLKSVAKHHKNADVMYYLSLVYHNKNNVKLSQECLNLSLKLRNLEQKALLENNKKN